MAESIEQVGLSLTTQGLAEQERALSGLRTCAGTVLAAASVAGSVLGARASHVPLDAWDILAMLAFVCCLGSAIWVLMPHELVFAFRGDLLVAASDLGEPLDVRDVYRATGRWIEPHLPANRRKIRWLSKWLTASCVLLAVEVIMWILSVVS
jgi:hypothetical protein